MHCNYCQTTNLKESRHYNIENVRERFNPTYFHSQIFGNTQPVIFKVRCTPTFHSQAFKIDGYGHNCKVKKFKKAEVVSKNTNVNLQARKTNKSGDFSNNRGKSYYNGRVKWYDQEKNQKFNHIQSTSDYSRERKYADLASSSVFDGYVQQSYCASNQFCKCVNCQCVNCECGKIKIRELQVKQCSPGCQCINCNCLNCQCGQQAEVKNCNCMNCKCTDCKCEKQNQANNCLNCPQTNEVVQVPKQSCLCRNCKCANCKCEKKAEIKTCKCVNCNCQIGCCQKNSQQKPVIVQIDKGKEQVTFVKKGSIKLQKGFSQPKKVIKDKPTFTVIRQKR